MGLTFSIPDEALVAPRPELLDEFISTRPPAICWRAGAALRLSDYGDGTNYQGDSMSPSSAVALSQERSRHLLARRARLRSAKERSRSATPSRDSSREARLRTARARDEV